MEVLRSSILTQPFCEIRTDSKDDHNNDSLDGDRSQVTPQYVIDSLSRYTVRMNGAYSQPEYSCGICYCKYRVGDKIICLPCQHTFHDYCIENWLKWVKSTCPVDKKSIIRYQYLAELVKERKNLKSDLCAQNDHQDDASSCEEDFLCSDDERIIFLESIPEKIAKKKPGNHNIRQLTSSGEYSPKLLSPLSHKRHTKSNFKQSEPMATTNVLISNVSPEKPSCESLKPNTGNLGISASVFAGTSPKQLRESVDAIRISIKTKKLSSKKCWSPNKFQEELQTVISKLSSSSISSPKMMPSSGNKNRVFGYIRKCGSPSKSVDLEKHVSLRGIMGKKSLTFGDILELENEVTSGWVFEKNKRVPYDPNGLQTNYSHVLG